MIRRDAISCNIITLCILLCSKTLAIMQSLASHAALPVGLFNHPHRQATFVDMFHYRLHNADALRTVERWRLEYEVHLR